jgi:hypothetical protein
MLKQTTSKLSGSTLILLATLMISASGYAQPKSQEPPSEAPIEAKGATVTRAEPGGYIMVRNCKTCPMMTLQFDANTQAYANGHAVSLSTLPKYTTAPITVIYDPKTKIVKRVRW